jgi:hypothetical protein
MQTIYLNLYSCRSGSYRVIVGAELPGSRPLDPRDRIIARYAEDQRTIITFKQRLNMELDHYLGSCAQLNSLAETPQLPPPPAFGLIY